LKESAQYTIKGSKGISSADEKHTGVILHNDLDLTFRATVLEKLTPKDAVLLMVSSADDSVIEKPLLFNPEKNEVSAKFTLNPDKKKSTLFQLMYGYTDNESGFFLYKNCSQGFVLCDKPPVMPETTQGILLQGEFAGHVPAKDWLNTWAGGECAAPVVLVAPRKPLKQQRPGCLDTDWFDKAWVYPSDYLNHAVCDGMEIDIEAKMTGDFTGDPYCALLTKGSYHTGFRILVHNKGKLLFQLAGLDNGKPLGVLSSRALPKNKWVKIKLVYCPPQGDQSGEACIFIDGQEQGRRSIAAAMQPSAAVLGIGCEFRQPIGQPKVKLRPNFPGLIRSFSLSNLKK